MRACSDLPSAFLESGRSGFGTVRGHRNKRDMAFCRRPRLVSHLKSDGTGLLSGMDGLGSQTDTILPETYSRIPATQHSPGKAWTYSRNWASIGQGVPTTCVRLASLRATSSSRDACALPSRRDLCIDLAGGFLPPARIEQKCPGDILCLDKRGLTLWRRSRDTTSWRRSHPLCLAQTV